MITNEKIKAIANLTRLKIIKILDKAEELSVSELELKLKMSQSAISQHLAIMRAAGLEAYLVYDCLAWGPQSTNLPISSAKFKSR